MTWPEAGDTIAAIATPPGEAGIGIVRLSGPEAFRIARRLFHPRHPRDTWQSHRLYLGHILDSQGEVLDEVLLTFMQAPHTYTREDVVEIHCHSGFAVLRAILGAVLSQGARLARPGEFTLRAFLAGRLDLSQAEAVLEVIQARSTASLRVAAAHLAGGLGRRLGEISAGLLGVLVRLEAALDFPEEAAELSPESIRESLARPRRDLERLLGTCRQGRLVREGVKVVLAGRPNVGKSSLLNRLLDADRAIVTEIPGTTRDVIEETITLGGILLRLSDTAGLRLARDRVEELGVARSRELMSRADLILYLVDGSESLAPDDAQALRELAERPALIVINKTDLPAKIHLEDIRRYCPHPVAAVSALTGEGLQHLEAAILDLVLGGPVHTDGEMVTQVRHAELLGRAKEALNRGQELLDRTEPLWELVALEVKEALAALGEITGEEVGEAVLDQIFSEFCIGK
jgi:tRNA modification GTPase|uniref:tRNA modification GTPase MnmE n=1 Tax=Desulfobacca acetoxidans TaxID=60893 RepID=A0A7V6A1G8_9BACT